jgi:hypothetical protein
MLHHASRLQRGWRPEMRRDHHNVVEPDRAVSSFCDADKQALYANKRRTQKLVYWFPMCPRTIILNQLGTQHPTTHETVPTSLCLIQIWKTYNFRSPAVVRTECLQILSHTTRDSVSDLVDDLRRCFVKTFSKRKRTWTTSKILPSHDFKKSKQFVMKSPCELRLFTNIHMSPLTEKQA